VLRLLALLQTSPTEPPVQLPDRLRFGRFELRNNERQLLQDDRPVALGARAFDLLVALIERRDRLVGKAELLDVVWPGLVVEEANLPVQVSGLRKLIGAQAIATVPGRGYRFVAALEADAGASSVAEAAAAEKAPRATSRDVRPALPSLPATLIGRENDTDALVDVLRHQRMVTLVGTGGIGKTALALAAANVLEGAYPDGTCWVDLTAITSPALVVTAVAQALTLPTGRGNAQLAGLVAGLQSAKILVVLDNAEHVADAVGQLASALLRGTRGVHLLVTSQRPSKTEGERVFRVGPLEVPADGTPAQRALTIGSVALFMDQCQAAGWRFELDSGNVDRVIRLCRQLDGLPLALKLAAARLPLLGLDGFESRLDDRFRLLVGDSPSAPSRQKTLMATMEWSHALLSASEQIVFRKLAVCVGGFSLDLAIAISRDDAIDEWAVVDCLEGLVDRSLVVADGGDRPRYRLLESTRLYALKQLEGAGELAAMQLRHAAAMDTLLEGASESMWSSPDMIWIAGYGPELGNVRAAMDWCARHDPSLGLSLTGSAAGLFLLLGLLHEFGQRSAALEMHLIDAIDPRVAARFWVARSLCLWTVDHRAMLDCALRAERLYRSLNDLRGVGMALYCAACSWLIPADRASRVHEELSRFELEGWPRRLRFWVIDGQLQILASQSRYEELLRAATTLVNERATEASGRWSEDFVTWAGNWMVVADLGLGHVDRAVRTAREIVQEERTFNRRQPTFTIVLCNLARALIKQGNLDEARQSLAAMFDRCRVAGWHGFGISSNVFTLLAIRENRWRAAAALAGFADAAWQRIGRPLGVNLRFRTRARATLAQHLTPEETEELMAAGVLMDEEAVCALTLARG